MRRSPTIADSNSRRQTKKSISLGLCRRLPETASYPTNSSPTTQTSKLTPCPSPKHPTTSHPSPSQPSPPPLSSPPQQPAHPPPHSHCSPQSPPPPHPQPKSAHHPSKCKTCLDYYTEYPNPCRREKKWVNCSGRWGDGGQLL